MSELKQRKTAGVLRKELNELRLRVEQLEKELKTAFAEPEEAEPGDTLQDGSIVIERNPTSILVVAPESVSFRSEWDETFPYIYTLLKENNFRENQWFIPSEGQLRVAFFSKARPHFSKCVHWASGQDSYGCYPHFDFESGSNDYAGVRGLTKAVVRPFRLISF